jgi:hypothetical protein
LSEKADAPRILKTVPLGRLLTPPQGESSMSPLLIFHITTASIGLLGGVAAMSLPKVQQGIVAAEPSL